MTDHEWTALVTWQISGPAGHLSDDEAEELVQMLPGYGGTDQRGDTMQAQMVIEAPTLRIATDAAMKLARKAMQAIAALGEPTELRVLSRQARLLELAKPAELDLVAATGAGEILGVTKQRAHRIAATHRDFPDPVAKVSGMPVWTRASVKAFADSDWRQKPGPKPKGPAIEEEPALAQ